MTASLLGHRDVLKFFDASIAADRLSHAYCFVGPSQVGKRTVAETLAARLLEVDRAKLATMPDYMTVSRLFDEKKEKTKKDITVEQIQDVQRFLYGRPFLKQYKVTIIDEAEQLNRHAANALLKTLEEPSERSVLFLVVTDETMLPETIRSRCQMIYFSRVAEEDMRAFCLEQGVSSGQTEEMVRLSLGLPGLLHSWVREPELFERHKKEIDRFLEMIGKPLYKKMQIIEELFGDKTDHVAARNNLMRVLDTWQIVTRDLVLSAHGLTGQYMLTQVQERAPWSRETITRTRQSMLQAKRLLQDNVHPRLLVEQILIHLP